MVFITSCLRRLGLFFLLLALPLGAHADACTGLEHCRLDGSLRSQVVRVAVTDSGGVTAYHGVRLTLRLSNVGAQPLVLAYKDHSAQLTDEKGLVYKWSVKAAGIGVIGRDNADPQFQLAPGETREAQWESVLQYSTRNTVVGSVFDQSLTLAGLSVLNDQHIRTQREYLLDFPGLRATDGIGAQAGGQAVAMQREPAPQFGAPGMNNNAAPPPQAQGDACAGQPSCQAQGPLVAQVIGVAVTDSGGVTAYHGVKLTLRVRNVGNEPLILGYRVGSAQLSDDQGLAYNWGRSGSSEARYVHGIGEVSKDVADPQFQLAPGESRDFQIDRILQYSTRRTVVGTRFNFDLSLVRLAIVGPKQVRPQADYALNFPNLTGGGGFGGGAGVQRATDVGNAVKNLADLLKGKGK